MSMKKLIIAFVLVFPLISSASVPDRLEGTFSFSGMELVNAKEIEVVPLQNKERLKELKQDKYTCTVVQNFSRCTKTSTLSEIPEVLAYEIQSRYSSHVYNFTNSTESILLTNDAPAIKVWDIPDTVNGPEGEAQKYEYSILVSGFHKIKIPFLTGNTYFLVNNQEQISAHHFRTVQLTKFQMRAFTILAHFSKI